MRVSTSDTIAARVSMRSGRLPGPLGVGCRASSMTAPASSRTTPRHFVPPTSIPRRNPFVTSSGAPVGLRARSGLGQVLEAADRIEDAALGAALHEAGKRDDQL